MYQEVAHQQHQQELAGPGIGPERSMYPPRAPPPTAAGPPSDRQEYGVSMMGAHGGGGDLGADASGYEYEVKRQRLLQGGSAAASGMLNPYYQSQTLQLNQPSFPSSSASSAALQSGTSLNSYYAGASPTPAQNHGGAPGPASAMYSSYPQHTPNAAVAPSNPLHPGVNPSYAGNPGSAGYNTGVKPNHMNSGGVNSMGLSSANTNPGYMNNSGRSLNPLSSTPYSSSAHMPPYPGTGTSAPISSGMSPYHTGSPPGHLNHHTAGSPPPPPLPMMPFERRSPHLSHSPPPPFFKGPGFMPFPAFSRAFPVVRIRGLPFNCTESDVYDFFRGLDVVDVLLTHKQGRFSGEAYCVFGLPMQVELALHRNRKSMGQRYIEVFRSKKHEYYLAVAAEVSEQEKGGMGEPAPTFLPSKSTIDKEHLEHTGVLKLRGLPFSASKRDVIEFFKDFNLKDENIQFVVHSDGRASGEAFVEFDGPSQSKQAMSRDKMMLGSRYIELFPSSSEEAAKATGRYKK
ncbi:hypothetical protein GOP47_0004590 [Adiantum capillus-veneris]|uniref:RRM domain-containing protein n=1 Tax=Adiantum capillus-veneris TaxID=13818 RepID=A0A9D4V8C7_ADICA|nr:hypothetical protein GOP47_0004590 [Adiantum capillus-veneris]